MGFEPTWDFSNGVADHTVQPDFGYETYIDGAPGENRTHTPLRIYAPQTYASTSSATSAFWSDLLSVSLQVKWICTTTSRNKYRLSLLNNFGLTNNLKDLG